MKKIILITILSIVLNTMLFSQNIFVVTKTDDPDPFDHPYSFVDSLCDTAMYGTLQWAIRKTNDAPPPSEIRFNIPGAGQHIINLNFSFPAINKQVKIDGSSQPGYNYNNGPSIIIDGTNIPIYSCCFNFSSGCDNSIVKGIHIRNFWASTGVSVWSGNVSVSDCMFWNVGGQVYPWRNMGVYIAAPNAIVQGNIFGTDITATQNHGCAAEAVYLQSQYLPADNCLIGGSGLNEGNLIVNSGWNGITVVNGKYNKISRNRMYDNAGGINLLIYAGPGWWGNEGRPSPVIDSLTPSGVLYGTSQPNDFIELFGSSGPQNANEYLQSVVANASGNWNATMVNFNWPYFIATATDAVNNTSELSNAYEITIPPPMASCATATVITIDSICIPQNYLGQTTDIWFKFIPDTANVYINVSYPATTAATIDRMNVYEGDCDSLILYAQINNDTLSLYDLTPGNIYYLKLRATQTGYFNICGQKGETIFIPPDYEIEPPAGNGAYYVNKGQIIDTYNNLRPDIKYYSVNTSPEIYLTDTAISFVLAHIDTIAATPDTMQRVDMMLGGNAHLSRPYKREQATGYLNYYLGHCPQGVTNVNGYNRVVYPDAYPGVNLQCYSNSMGAKFYFVIKPGAKTNNIILKFNGTDAVNIDGNGNLIIQTSLGNIEFEHAQCYKVNPAGNIVPMPNQGDYVQISPTEIGFNLQQPPGNTMPVVIMMDKGHFIQSQTSNCDWSTYHGGGGFDNGNAILADASGNIFYAGETDSPIFPNIVGGLYTTNSGSRDAFIIKFDSQGAPVWGTYYGGGLNDMANVIEINSTGDIYIVGTTTSSDLPLEPPANTVLQGTEDAFIAKFNSSGDALLFSRYFGGNESDYGRDMTIDGNDNVYFVGMTGSNSGFPVTPKTGAFNQPSTTASDAYPDGFIAELDPADNLIWAIYFGGSGEDDFSCVKIGANNHVLCSGSTLSTVAASSNGSNPPCDVPLSPNYFPDCNPGGGAYFHGYAGTGVDKDAIIVEFDQNGALKWSTYFGGEGDESSATYKNSIAVNPNDPNIIYLVGYTTKLTGFPVYSVGAYVQIDNFSTMRAYIAKFNTRQKEWVTVFGAGPNTLGLDATVDDYNNVYLVGHTQAQTYSSNTCGPPVNELTEFAKCQVNGVFFQPAYGGGSAGDGFISAFNSSNKLIWSTYFGGNTGDEVHSITYDPSFKRIYITGKTQSTSGFPLFDPATGNYQWATNSGGLNNNDSYIARFCVESLIYAGITELLFDSTALLCYPNPASNSITIQLISQKEQENFQFDIFNALGANVFKQKAIVSASQNSFSFDISTLTKGIYMIQASTSKNTYTTKFIIQ